MKLVVDSNILFSFFWENSVSRELLLNAEIGFYSPEFALEEINKYQEEIIRKAKITKKEFKILREDLAISVVFVPVEEYKRYLKKAIEISPDPNDSDFFALSLKIETTLWSNDETLKDQDILRVRTTKDLLNNPEFIEKITKNEEK